MPKKKYVRPAPKPVDLVQASAKPILTLREVAAMTGFHEWTCRQFIAAGKLNTLSIPSTKGTNETAKVIRIARVDLDSFIESTRTKGAV